MNTIQITVAGNLTHDPELRFTSTGSAVTTLRVAVTPRRPAADGGFEDGETTYITCTVFGTPAEHAAESLQAGDRILASGRLVERSFTATRGDRQGETIRRHEVVVDEMAVSLRFAVATVRRAIRRSDDTEHHAV